MAKQNQTEETSNQSTAVETPDATAQAQETPAPRRSRTQKPKTNFQLAHEFTGELADFNRRIAAAEEKLASLKGEREQLIQSTPEVVRRLADAEKSS